VFFENIMRIQEGVYRKRGRAVGGNGVMLRGIENDS